jgi:Tol biopolymer transport system component
MIRQLTLFIVHCSLLIALAACGPGRQPDQVSITLIADRETRSVVMPQGQTVRDVLKTQSITLGELDRVRPPETTPLQNGLSITVTRIVQQTQIVTQAIAFTTQVIPDAALPAGQRQIQQAGHNGTLQITFRATYADGQLTGRDEIDRLTIDPPVPEIARVGLQDFSTTVFSGTLVYLSNHNAFVMRDLSTNKRPLTTQGDLDGRVFALSPDGRWLMYSRQVTATLNSLWIVDTTLAKPEVRSLKINGVLWAGFAPDGKSIAFTRADAAPGQPGWRAYNDLNLSSFNNGTIGAAKSVLTQSATAPYSWWGTAYDWSPDSKWIAYANTESIGVISLTAKITKSIELDHFTAYNTRSTWAWTPIVSWSPDGRFIVATVHAPSPTGDSDETSPAFDVNALANDGTFNIRLINNAGMWSAPRWTSSQIIFGEADTPFASDVSHYRLHSMDRDGSNHTLLFPAPDSIGLDGLPDYDLAPDNRSLVAAYQGDLYMIDFASSNITSRRITAEGTVSHPRWAR